MRPILKSPRIIRTGRPLELATIQQVCPAVFAPGPHESRGPRYQYVPTIQPLELLMANGWGVYEASQQRSRAADRDPYTKHMLRLRKLADFDAPVVVGEGVPEVILINAHDGTAAYHLRAGFFRFVCSNGMIVGQTLAGFKVTHTVGHQTSEAVLTAGERLVTERFPQLMDNITAWQRIMLTTEQQYRLAQRGLDLRYGNTLPPIKVDDLLTVRRPEDAEPTLWNVLNRVQEAAIYGGWQTVSAGWQRRSTVRPVERVSAVTAINGGLWDAATALAEEVAA